ncbi:MAG: DMT family transporter [Proteobacteria bacterium]|nr:DMT family transporter [Pseudomonadota bacterium]
MPCMQSPIRIASLTVLAMLAFAGNSLLCRIALRDTAIDAASFTSIRLVSGAVLLAVLMIGRGKRPWAGGTWRAAAMLFAYAVTFSFAYRQLTAATGALLLFGAVQMTMLGCGLAAGERLRGMQWLGLLVALAGLVGLLLPGIAAPPLLGAVFMLAAGAAWGVYSLLGRGVTDPVAGTAGNFLRTVPFTAVLSLSAASHASFDTMGLLYAIASGAITSGLGYVLWYAALPAFRAASAATIQLSVPALAALGGVLLLGEQMSLRLLVASVAILGGIALVILRRQ